MSGAETIIGLAQGWGAVGALVAVVFLFWGIDRIDEDARGAYVFRVLLIPGVLLIWPLVLWRWAQMEDAPWMNRYRPVLAHRYAVSAMAVLIALAVLLGLSVRQEWPADIAPIQIGEADQS